MNRRKIIVAGTAAAVAQTVATATGCKAEGGTTPAAHVAPSGGGFADALAACTLRGEECLTHCLTRLANGDASLGACAMRVREMLAVCPAVESLVLADSSHVPQAAALCISVCKTCRAECERHAGHHPECRACAEACSAVIQEAQRVAA